MPATSVAQAIRFIFHGSPPSTNPNLRIFDYGDEKVFRDLWLGGLDSDKPTINRQAYDWTQTGQQVLIIGNDPPSDALAHLPESLRGINFRSHFTATSWLAAWKVKFPEAKAAIAVIDPRKTDLTTGVALALQTILGARDASGQTLIPRAAILTTPSLKSICQWLHDSAKDTARETAPHLCELLKTAIWNALTSASEQHHALSNVLGPMVLSGTPTGDWDLPDTQDPNNKTKTNPNRPKILLRRLLRACGLVSWEDREPGDGADPLQATPDATNEPQAAEQSRKSEELGKDLSILLVDDQADEGWEAWVKEVLRDAEGAMKSLTDPTKLVNSIRTALAPRDDGTFEKRDARFSLELPSLGKDASNPVLMLDLRLFAGNPDAERKFYKTLLPLVAYFKNRSDLAWPAFNYTDDEFKALKDAIEATDEDKKLKVDSDKHHEVLTWLPRVIALADMSLPIILFSSTGRRDLVEPFKAYGSIITCFEKPRLSEIGSRDVRQSTVHALRRAIGDARNIAGAAAQIREIRTMSLSQYDAARKAFNGKKRIEVFHDESFNPDQDTFRVAAFAVGFPEKYGAVRTNERITARGPRFFGRGALAKITEPTEGVRQWNDAIAAPLKAALEAGGATPTGFLPFVIVSGEGLKGRQVADPLALLDPSGLDNLNQSLLRILLEVMICDTLAWVTDDLETECCFFGATRMRAQDAGGGEPSNDELTNIKTELQERWRINVNEVYKAKDGRTFRWQFKWQSLRRDSFHGLLNELLSARSGSERGTAFAGRIVSAYGTRLPAKEDETAHAGYRYLHSIADIVARLVNMDVQSGLATWDALASNVNLPITLRGAARFRPQLVRILNCHRALDEGDLADGFGYGLSVNHVHDVAGNVVALRLRESVQALTGQDFVKIVRHVAESGPAWTHSPRLSEQMHRAGSNRQHAMAVPSQPQQKKTGFLKSTKPAPRTSLAPSRPQYAPHFSPNEICIRQLPDQCNDALICAELLKAKIECRGLTITKNSLNHYAIVMVNPTELARILKIFSSGINLLGKTCEVVQAKASGIRMNTPHSLAPARIPLADVEIVPNEAWLGPVPKAVEPLRNPLAALEALSAANEGIKTNDQEKWRIRRFSNYADYLSSNVEWHKIKGIEVRRSNSGVISVFADISVVPKTVIDGFDYPKKNSFREDGSLCGIPYQPPPR